MEQKPAYRRILTFIHIVGAMVCMAIASRAFATGPSNCNQEFYINCDLPCVVTQLRFPFDCCNTVPGGCCQRKCQQSICSGPSGAACVKPPTEEYSKGTLNLGQTCNNNYCGQP